MLLGVLLASVLLTQCIWPSDIINNLRAEMTSHPKVRRVVYKGRKEWWWGKKRYLLTVFAAGNPRDKCKNHKMNRFWMISGFTLFCCTQYNQRFSVIKIRPHTDAKTDLHIEQGLRNTSTHITKYANFFKHTFHTTFFKHQWGKTCQTHF